MFGLKFAASAGALIGALVVGPIAYIAGDLFGGWEASVRAELQAQVAAAQAQRDAAQRDLAATALAARFAEQAAADDRAAAAQAEDRLHDYEEELKARGDADRCALTADDVRRLREPSSARAAQSAAPTDGAGVHRSTTPSSH